MLLPDRRKEQPVPDVLFEKRPDGVGLITLNRPDSLNALAGDMRPLIMDALAECEADRSVRCVALTGAGRAFCAGGDVKTMAAGGPVAALMAEGLSVSAALERSTEDLRRTQAGISLRLHTMAKPTVALVNGHAVGAGMSIALACDLRFCSDQARFGTGFRNVAQSGDYGGSYFLQRLVGVGRARELYFFAEVIDAERALALGIANQVVPHEEFLDKGLEYCARLASGPTAAYGRMKRNLNLAATATLRDLLEQEAYLMRISSLDRDYKEATTAFVEKRQPRFVGE
jgi:2-(1,2-epoxy-1,2-dihydrophenyl)acetyl-CoA isomerase